MTGDAKVLPATGVIGVGDGNLSGSRRLGDVSATFGLVGGCCNSLSVGVSAMLTWYGVKTRFDESLPRKGGRPSILLFPQQGRYRRFSLSV